MFSLCTEVACFQNAAVRCSAQADANSAGLHHIVRSHSRSSRTRWGHPVSTSVQQGCFPLSVSRALPRAIAQPPSHGRRSLPSVHEMHFCQIQDASEQPCRQGVTGLGGIFGFGGFFFFWEVIRSAHCSYMVLVHCYVSMLHKIMGFQKCGKRTVWNLIPVHWCPSVIPNSRSRWSCPCFPS